MLLEGMDEIRRQDLKVFARELLAPGRIVGFGFLGLFSWWACKMQDFNGPLIPFSAFVAWLVLLAMFGASSYSASTRKRFINRRFSGLWNGCLDRLNRFEDVLGRLRREGVAELNEMPITIHRVGAALYGALRRADLIAHEIRSTEEGLYGGSPVWHAAPSDPQSQELYKLADRNIAEYRQRLDGLMAGVQRTEAQSAVFMTTLDTLRMKMLGYRLVGRAPELSSRDFLDALTEAKLQLDAIDTALEELELGPFPTMVATVPPPIPQDVRERLRGP